MSVEIFISPLPGNDSQRDTDDPMAEMMTMTNKTLKRRNFEVLWQGRSLRTSRTSNGKMLPVSKAQRKL